MNTSLLQSLPVCFRSLLAVSAVCCLPVPADSAENVVLQRFKTNSPTAWKEYLELARCIEGECSAKTFDLLTGQTIEDQPLRKFRNNGFLAYHPITSNGRKLIICQNLDYGFIIENRSPEKWLLHQLEWKDRHYLNFATESYCDNAGGRIGSYPWQRVLSYASRGLMIDVVWMPHLCSQPTFEVVDAQEVRNPANANNYVMVKFVNRLKRGPLVNIESGEMTLDPHRYWQIVSAHIKGHEGVEGPDQLALMMEIENEFAMADNRLPYARRQSLTTIALPHVHRQNIYTTKLSLKEPSELTPFYLPAFGLPEPPREP